MAVCLTISNAMTSGGGMALRLGSSGSEPLPWVLGNASFVDGVYTCPTGTHILLTPSELSDLNPFHAGPEHYAAVTAVFGACVVALAVIWGVRQILKIFNTHTES